MERIKKKVSRYWVASPGVEVTDTFSRWQKTTPTWAATDKERIGKVASTPHPCSCGMGCGNARKFEGPTRNEKAAALTEQDELQYWEDWGWIEYKYPGGVDPLYVQENPWEYYGPWGYCMDGEQCDDYLCPICYPCY